jgi:hypothetical protein
MPTPAGLAARTTCTSHRDRDPLARAVEIIQGFRAQRVHPVRHSFDWPVALAARLED